MRIFLALSVLAASCSREAPPRDYQNSPPAMTHPATNSAQSPSQNGMPAAAPEPSKGVEGKNPTRKPVSAIAPTLTLKDQAPSTELGPPPSNSQHVTQTTSTAATGTHLATPP